MTKYFLAAIVSGLGLALVGVIGVFAEFKPYLEPRNTPQQRFETAEIGVLAPGFSNDAHMLAINDCMQVTSGFFGRAQPTQRRSAAVENCALLADRIIAGSPAHGYAWLLRATTAKEYGVWSQFNNALFQSQRVNPSEQWLAELRVQLFEDHFENLSDAARRAEASDLTMLVQSRRGIRSIANRYVDNEAFRERITSIVEALPPEVQARFVNTVRHAARS